MLHQMYWYVYFLAFFLRLTLWSIYYWANVCFGDFIIPSLHHYKV